VNGYPIWSNGIISYLRFVALRLVLSTIKRLTINAASLCKLTTTDH